MTVQLDLREAIYALSDALDLVGVDEVQHGKRVAFMALECGRRLGNDDDVLEMLFHGGLLHDCGVSSTRMHRHLVDELDWDGAQEHCDVGYHLLQDFAPLAELAPIVKYHHTHWEDLPRTVLDERQRRVTNLIYLVDRVDALSAVHYGHDILKARHGIRDRIAGLAGSFFEPLAVEAFLHVSTSEAFWFSLEPRHMELFLRRMEQSHRPVRIGMTQLRHFAAIFARIVDAKSRFTWEHSEGVARLARYLGQRLGLAGGQCDKLEIAGLLHDLGKLQIPDEVLDKPGPLTDEERAEMTRHSFETYQILNRIPGLEDIARWAAYHHECLDGAGYPFHRSGGELPLEARIVAVADVFQALAQNRPYREPLNAVEVQQYLERFAKQRHLDPQLVSVVANNLDACWAQATGTTETQAAPAAG